MKTIKYLLFAFTSTIILSCSDDDKANNVQTCNCYYVTYEASQLQGPEFNTPSDTTDCSLDGTIVYFPGWEGSTVYYRKLVCE